MRPTEPELIPLRDLNSLAGYFSRLSQPLYALIDTARHASIKHLLENSCCDYRILYDSRFAAIMDDVGPHLVAVSKDSPFLSNLLEKGWGNGWVILLCSSEPQQSVWRHLRRLLTVKLPDRRFAHFRYYDPRVLREYLLHCPAEDIPRFF